MEGNLLSVCRRSSVRSVCRAGFQGNSRAFSPSLRSEPRGTCCLADMEIQLRGLWYSPRTIASNMQCPQTARSVFSKQLAPFFVAGISPDNSRWAFYPATALEQWRDGRLIAVPQAWGVKTMLFFFTLSMLIRGGAGSVLSPLRGSSASFSLWSVFLAFSFHTDTAWAIGVFRSLMTQWLWTSILSEQIILVHFCSGIFFHWSFSFEAPDFQQHYSAVSEGGFHWLDLLGEYTYH